MKPTYAEKPEDYVTAAMLDERMAAELAEARNTIRALVMALLATGAIVIGAAIMLIRSDNASMRRVDAARAARAAEAGRAL